MYYPKNCLLRSGAQSFGKEYMGQLHTLLNLTTVSIASDSVNRHLEAERSWLEAQFLDFGF